MKNEELKMKNGREMKNEELRMKNKKSLFLSCVLLSCLFLFSFPAAVESAVYDRKESQKAESFSVYKQRATATAAAAVNAADEKEDGSLYGGDLRSFTDPDDDPDDIDGGGTEGNGVNDTGVPVGDALWLLAALAAAHGALRRVRYTVYSCAKIN